MKQVVLEQGERRGYSQVVLEQGERRGYSQVVLKQGERRGYSQVVLEQGERRCYSQVVLEHYFMWLCQGQQRDILSASNCHTSFLSRVNKEAVAYDLAGIIFVYLFIKNRLQPSG